jgi:hypothetical protein
MVHMAGLIPPRNFKVTYLVQGITLVLKTNKEGGQQQPKSWQKMPHPHRTTAKSLWEVRPTQQINVELKTITMNRI